MARTLSGIAKYKLNLATILAAAIISPCRWGQTGVTVAPATKTVQNPFSSKARAWNAPQSTAVPGESEIPSKTYQNPFAERSAQPRVLTPMPRSGSLSRWRRPVELPGSRSATTAPAAEESRWDTLAPDALGEQFEPEPPQQVELELHAPIQAQRTAPPDPIRFAPSALHQPYWLLPNPATGDDAAREPIAAAIQLRQVPASGNPEPARDPFEEPTDGAVVISDAPQANPAAPRNAAECYAQAEQAAAAASTVEELGSVVRLCQEGLSTRPQGDVARSLRTLAAWASNRRGEIKSDDRREDEALREFEIAIQFDPNCWLALHNRGVSRAQQGQAERALQDFNRAIDLNPGHAIAYRNRGELLAVMGRTEEAVADYGRAISQLPDDASLLLMRGHALHRLGRYDESLTDLNRAIELAPQFAEAYAHRGNVFAERGEFTRAAKDFQQSLRLDPESPDAYRSLAWLMATCPDARFRDPEQALAAAERAATLAPPDDCFVLDALAAAHANAGHFELAVRYQKEAVTAAPQDFQSPFAGRLALYQQRRPFRNGPSQAIDRGVRAVSAETGTRQQ